MNEGQFPTPPDDRRADLNGRLRQAFIEGAEADSQGRLGRGLTAAELERVLRHYPGDFGTTPGTERRMQPDGADLDPLTGLLARSELDTLAAEAAVAYVDLRDFRRINDAYGHDGASLCLVPCRRRPRRATLLGRTRSYSSPRGTLVRGAQIVARSTSRRRQGLDYRLTTTTS